MQIAIISDIHANYEALIQLADFLARADKVLCLGDFVGYYCQVNEVLDFVRALDPICVMGNHDAFLLNGYSNPVNPAVRFGIEFADKVITHENRAWLQSLPLTWGGVIGGISVLLAHGSPWNPLEDYLYQDNPWLDRLIDFNYDLIVFGQTHRTLLRRDQKPWLLNPGSVGQSRDRPGIVCAALLDTVTKHLTILEWTYNPMVTIRLAKGHGADDWILKHLT